MSKALNRVSISTKGTKGKIDPRTVKGRALRVLDATGAKGSELSLLLCNDDFISQLNRDYRGLEKPTDVLSFSMTEGEPSGMDSKLLGDVVVSVETAAKQASDANRTLTDEVTSLVIHGILHLLGFSHGNKKSKKAMFEEAARLEKIVRVRT